MLSEYSVLCESSLFVNIWHPISETHFKSGNVKSQHCSHTSGAPICSGRDLRDSDLTFHRRDSEYLLWFELEVQKYPFPTPLALLTLHATTLLLDIFTIPPVEMLVSPPRSYSHQELSSSTAGTMLAQHPTLTWLPASYLNFLCGLNSDLSSHCVIKPHVRSN